jgi:hypothetical protein
MKGKEHLNKLIKEVKKKKKKKKRNREIVFSKLK